MADLDSALKRGSGIHPSSPWRGLYPFPDGTIGQPDRQVAAWLYSGISSGAPATTAAVTGTATASITEADIVAGGKTIIITLANDTWVAAGAAFNAQRQAIINGLDAASSPALGWNDEVRDKEVVGSVVRDSDTQVTVTLTASPLYDIAATETITITVPSAALVTSLVDVTATPTFDVSFVAPPVVTTTTGGKGDNEKGRKRLGVPFKPTGLIDRPKRKEPQEGRKDVDARVEESAQIAAEISAKLAREFGEETQRIEEEKRVVEMSRAEIDFEIGVLLKKKLRTEEDELMLVLLMVAASE